jgi:hypothetical protein
MRSRPTKKQGRRTQQQDQAGGPPQPGSWSVRFFYDPSTERWDPHPDSDPAHTDSVSSPFVRAVKDEGALPALREALDKARHRGLRADAYLLYFERQEPYTREAFFEACSSLFAQIPGGGGFAEVRRVGFVLASYLTALAPRAAPFGDQDSAAPPPEKAPKAIDELLDLCESSGELVHLTSPEGPPSPVQPEPPSNPTGEVEPELDALLAEVASFSRRIQVVVGHMSGTSAKAAAKSALLSERLTVAAKMLRQIRAEDAKQSEITPPTVENVEQELDDMLSLVVPHVPTVQTWLQDLIDRIGGCRLGQKTKDVVAKINRVKDFLQLPFYWRRQDRSNVELTAVGLRATGSGSRGQNQYVGLRRTTGTQESLYQDASFPTGLLIGMPETNS